ncbi:MAG: twin-arginine translocase TatA/TatE family subunit [Bdellovibrionales bacterium]
MGLSLTHVILLLIVVLVIFGVGKLPKVMGDLGKGIRNFKAGLNGDKIEDKSDKQPPVA